MSYDEIGMTVNSDFNVPLNHLIWLQDYKTFGENSYVYRDKKIWNELAHSKISGLDNSVVDSVVNYFIDYKPDDFGIYMANRYPENANTYKEMDLVSCLTHEGFYTLIQDDAQLASVILGSSFDRILEYNDDSSHSIAIAMIRNGFDVEIVRDSVKSSTYLADNLQDFEIVKTVENLKVTDANKKTEALPSGKYYIISVGQRASNYSAYTGYPLTIMHTIDGGTIVPGNYQYANNSYNKYTAVNDYFYDLYMYFPTALIGGTGISETGMLKYINLDEV